MEIKFNIDGTDELALFSEFGAKLEALKAEKSERYNRAIYGIAGHIEPDVATAAEIIAEQSEPEIAATAVIVEAAPAPTKPKAKRAPKVKVEAVAVEPEPDPYPETAAEKAAIVPVPAPAAAPSLESVCAALQKFVNAHSLPAAMQIVKVFEVAKMKDLPEDKRADFLAALDERAAELTVGA